ncbi:MAG: aryl-sulfate sulfotransferase [Henriciella sp.]|nr:aryl-sulfate sulfotransferase [Henriciella sp.]
MALVVSPLDKLLATDPVDRADADPVELIDSSRVQPGLIAVLLGESPRKPAIRIIDRRGTVIHEWTPRWQDLWPKGEGKFYRRPVRGMFAHGLHVTAEGDIVTNFEFNSTFRLDLCGEVVWKLDNHGHHAVAADRDGKIWVPIERVFLNGPAPYIGHIAHLRANGLQQIDANGEIIKTIDLFDNFIDQGLHGLMHIGRGVSANGEAMGDTMHVNDIEVFPEDVESLVFDAGDLLVSARHLNAIFVIDPITERVKWYHSGGFVRQHDPDFTDRGTITFLDNFGHFSSDQIGRKYSRIIEIDPVTNTQKTILGADLERPFYTEISGSHEWLPNGNILVVASQEGRLLEYTPDGQLVWRYDNRLPSGENGRVYNTQFLPPHMDKAFFEAAKRSCEQ